MKMFLGEYNPNITEGSRIALPKKFREQISENDVVLSKGFETCIYIYAKEDWTQTVHKQVESSAGSVKQTDLERYLYASASEVSIDSQGRLVLPSNLKDYARISDKTAVVGVGDHIEVWDKDTWQKHLEKISARLD
jgi:MraZ protein